jgi:hypothetical protein
VNATLKAEADAYRADLDAALLVTHPNIASTVHTAVTNLENKASSIAQSGGTNARSQLPDAVKAFDTSILDKNGLFGPDGVVSLALARRDHGHDSD